MEKTPATALIIGVLALIGTGSFLLFAPVSTQKIPMSLAVANYTGFNVDTTGLLFGAVPPGGTVRRTVVVENTWEGALSVRLRATGELAAWTTFSPSSLVLLQGANASINVFVSVPSDAQRRDYKGTTLITFSRP